MGLRCYLVLVFMVHASFALECANVFNSKTTTCDECIRCDGIWCKDPTESTKQCNGRMEAKDHWCPVERENKVLTVEPNSQPGAALNPKYVEVLAEINKVATTTLVVNGGAQAHYEVLNTTQFSGQSKVEVKLRPQYTKGPQYSLDVITIVHIGFCSPNSTKSEYVFVKVWLDGVDETSIVKYHVPCACACSEHVEQNSPTCSGAGTLTCGSCQCNDYTFGRHCEKNKCRGDIESSSCKPSSSNEIVECSGNGKCDHCGVCHCYTSNITIQGSQYFVPEDNCQDICATVNKCDDCLTENEMGLCESCVTPYVTFQELNVSLLEDEMNGRKMWVNCSVTLGCGVVEYAVSKTDNINVMVFKDCGANRSGFVGASKVTIPVVIGVLAAIAGMVAAAAGYVAWKGKGALPTAGSNYANIEPEDSVGVNPLYKPPTSSFKNPMFGKS